MEIVLEYLPENLANYIYRITKERNYDIEEIRLRNNKFLCLKTASGNVILEYIVTTKEIKDTFEKICENSIYSYKRQICEGFITIKNGHRVGITGNCAFENGQVVNINYISSLNFRIAKERKGCANELLKYIIDDGDVCNTLIVSKPGCGKTTILRDIIRQISNKGKTCGIVDERGEIAAMFKGIPQNDVGILTDVIDNVSKEKGMQILIRSMAPDIIACDEIGSKEDIEAINHAICSGVKGIFTAHGETIEELLLNKQISVLFQNFLIEKIIILNPEIKGNIKEKYYLDKNKKKYIKF